MVTYYNRKDLVAFGNHILSVERSRVFKLEKSGDEPPTGPAVPDISQANIDNWKHAMVHNKLHDTEQ